MGNPSNRIVGFDIARALAILGMVMVNYKLALDAVGNGPNWLVISSDLLEGRASAIFVILAGIGTALMTKKARVTKDPSLIMETRRIIWKRSLFLLGLGMVLYFIGWDADILHYYAFYMLVASFFIVVTNRSLLFTIIGVLLTSQLFQLIFDYTQGWDANFQSYESFWSPDGFVRNLFLNGYHPLFPWICFFLFGMWLGRLNWKDRSLRRKLMGTALVVVLVVEWLSYSLIVFTKPILGTEIARYLFQTKPMPPTLLYMVSSACTALIVILLCIRLSEKIRERWVTKLFEYTGQLALTHYVGHFFVLLLLFLFGYLNHSFTLSVAMGASFGFFIVAMIGSYAWRSFFSRGPIEWMMRKVSENWVGTHQAEQKL
ncbi:DUF418 domain-containing protein [Marininema halotolerans]|uniref:Uncharacterized membrane protein YeiB n=1 Tax=Marininema halotolerans TaxID=1155944 RepID=A0A1I6R8V9_9BACL|nr:DUF418 domain-containing protein [Marininema halotolerans]SFS61132.1 Uncharacterized membrane protein YeiB [Marininema halotolerans]